MGIIEAVTAAFKAVAAVFGFGQQVATNTHDDNERQAGQDAASVGVQQATIDSQQRQARAGVNGPASADEVVDRLNKGSF